MLYNDYFSISEDYAPCMTQAAINRNPETWMQFYPHETFVDTLRDLLECMNGGNKSIWLTGAYGTGKSHAALVLQKLFMDDAERVKTWLKHRAEQIPEAVGAALMKLRNNHVFVVFDTNSDGIKTPEQFIVRMENTIIKALKGNGYSIPVFGDQDRILERIHEEEAAFFKKRDEIQGQLSALTSNIKNADELEKAMQNASMQLSLLNDVMKVMHERSIYLDITSQNLIKWVEDILKANNLSRILYIWDEFSSYIDQNRSQLKTFEEVAEASQEGKFFFMPVTHMSIDAYLASGSESAKKANNRFIFKALSMPTNTALHLAADALQVTNAGWDAERDMLWHGISNVVTSYMANIDDECKKEPTAFKGILPIHPMTAFVLKFLSSDVGANQRSMFNFLKGEVGQSEFQDFISSSGPDMEGRQYLTVDHLWHFFVERSDLGIAKEVTEIRNEFNTKSNNLNDVEKRLFKAVLLYSLLGRITGEAGNELLQPLVKNIERCFEGDGNVVGVKNLLEEMEKKHCFSIINGRCESFRNSASSDELESMKDKLRTQFDEQFLQMKVLPKLESETKKYKDKLHFVARVSTIDKTLTRTDSKKDIFSEKGEKSNKILLQFIIAKDAEEQLRVEDKAIELAKIRKDFRMLFIVLPELNFCTTNMNNWEDYIDQLAHKELATDESTKTNYNTQISLMDTIWLGKLMNQSQKLKIFKPNPNGEPYVEERTWKTLEDYLKQYLKDCFEYYVDDLSGYNLTAMKEGGSALQAWALSGMDFSKATGAMKNFCGIFSKNNISDNPNWFDQNPSHVLTKIRDYCKTKLNNALNGSTGTCSLRKIYIDLMRAPFGFVSTPFTAFVLGFVLKEWVDNPKQQLQWTLGFQSEKLDTDALAEIIEAVVKDDGNNDIKTEKLICRISQEEKIFIADAPTMFGIEHVPNATVSGTLDLIAKRLEKISNKVPLWVLPEYIHTQNDSNEDDCIAIINDLCEAQKISSKGDQQERTNRIKAIGKRLHQTAGLAELFSKYINAENFDTAFKMHVNRINPGMEQLAKTVGDLSGIYCTILKEHFAETASWLWNAQNVEDEIELLEAKYQIIQIFQSITGLAAYIKYDDVVVRLKKAIETDNKISIELLAGKYPFLTEFMEAMNASGVGDGLKKFAESFKRNQDSIKALFFEQTKKIQIEILKSTFESQLASLADSEINKLYADSMTSGAKRNPDEFKANATREIDEYLKKSTMQQLLAMWEQKTGSKSPAEWSASHKMPSSVLFESIQNAFKVVPLVNNPKNYQTGALENAIKVLFKETIPEQGDIDSRFLQRVLPKKYDSLNISASGLADALTDTLGNNPDNWQQGPKMLDAVEKFVRERYASAFKEKALNKVKVMSPEDAKKKLISFVEKNPDVGLDILG